MNLIEEFRDGAYTLSELSDEYYEGILRKVKVFAERKRHIGLIASINIAMAILVFIGYKYNFI